MKYYQCRDCKKVWSSDNLLVEMFYMKYCPDCPAKVDEISITTNLENGWYLVSPYSRHRGSDESQKVMYWNGQKWLENSGYKWLNPEDLETYKIICKMVES